MDGLNCGLLEGSAKLQASLDKWSQSLDLFVRKEVSLGLVGSIESLEVFSEVLQIGLDNFLVELGESLRNLSCVGSDFFLEKLNVVVLSKGD